MFDLQKTKGELIGKEIRINDCFLARANKREIEKFKKVMKAMEDRAMELGLTVIEGRDETTNQIVIGFQSRELK